MRSISWPTSPVAPMTPTSTPISLHLLQLERRVEGAHRRLRVGFLDHARDADGRRADHLDVDAPTRQDLEHLRGHPGIGLHARADERDARDTRVVRDTGRLD